MFLCHHEEKWLDACPREFKPVLYKRYVDDIFVLFTCRSHLDKFALYMNAQHQNIVFTTETENNSMMSFLDVSICHGNQCFNTSVYRKPMFSGVYSNFDSFIPLCYKFGLVFTLFGRLFNICSSFVLFHKEVLVLKSLLVRNGFTLPFVDSVLKKFLNAAHRPPKATVATVNRKNVFMVLPYCGVISLQVRTRIMSLCRKHFPQVSFRIVLKPSCRISNMFPYKDTVPMLLRSGLIYQYKCSGCNSTYYGKTIRHAKTRFCEHIGVSPLTGKPVSDPQITAVFEHFVDCTGDRPTFDDFSVLCSGSSDFILKMKESLLIKQDDPILNRKVSSLPLCLF